VNDPATLRATVDEYLRAGRERDRSAWLALFADDATLEDPVGTDAVQGRGELESFYDRSMGSTDAIDNRLREIRVSGDTVAFLFDLDITWKGRRYRVSPIDVLEFDSAGKIIRMRAHWAPDDMSEVHS